MGIAERWKRKMRFHLRRDLLYPVGAALTGGWAVAYPFIHLATQDVFSDGRFGVSDVLACLLAQTVPPALLLAGMWQTEIVPFQPSHLASGRVLQEVEEDLLV